MRVLVLSDIHGNLPALEALVKKAENVDQWLCLGDIVNYGPWSNECVQLVNGLPNSVTIMGNHEEYFLQGAYQGKSSIGQAFFEQCYPQFTERHIIEHYPEHILLGGFFFTHTLNGEYLFHDSEVEISQPTCIGHSHQQYLVERSGYQLLNPGSVGQDRKYINRANYAIYDTESGEIELKNFVFNIDWLLSEMRARAYPQECIDYYNSKKLL